MYIVCVESGFRCVRWSNAGTESGNKIQTGRLLFARVTTTHNKKSK